MLQTIIVKLVDVKFLKKQKEFLLDHFKHSQFEEIGGLVKMIDTMLDYAEKNK